MFQGEGPPRAVGGENRVGLRVHGDGTRRQRGLLVTNIGHLAEDMAGMRGR